MLHEKPPKKTDRLFYFLSMLGIAILAVLFVWGIVNTLTGRTNSISRENNALLKVGDCKTSVLPIERTAKQVDKCYKVVEKQTGIKLHRYDKDD